jgi:hypothetical protein
VKRFPLATPLVLLALAGCGSDDAAPVVDESDLPGSALACLEQNDIAATREGEAGNRLVLEAGPHIRFYLTAAEAEAAQFQGRGEGAEQIGSALLFVEPETSEEMDELLKDVEGCLADL